jgi:hypothetical protein
MDGAADPRFVNPSATFSSRSAFFTRLFLVMLVDRALPLFFLVD